MHLMVRKKDLGHLGYKDIKKGDNNMKKRSLVPLDEAFYKGLIGNLQCVLITVPDTEEIMVSTDISGAKKQQCFNTDFTNCLWRIFKMDNTFYLVSERPVAEELYLSGEAGRENGINVANDIVQLYLDHILTVNAKALDQQTLAYLLENEIILSMEKYELTCWLPGESGGKPHMGVFDKGKTVADIWEISEYLKVLPVYGVMELKPKLFVEIGVADGSRKHPWVLTACKTFDELLKQ